MGVTDLFRKVMTYSVIISVLFMSFVQLNGSTTGSEEITRSPTEEPVLWGTTDVDIGSVGLKFFGEENADHAGHCVEGVGDVNGDGIDDFAIGAYARDEGGYNSGQVYLFFGREDGFPDNTSVNSADASFLGTGDEERAGIDISGAGDVNGDGYDDFVIGADEYAALGTTGKGRAYLILGRETGWIRDMSLANANASWIGEVKGDMFGRAVGGGGDVNGDGFDDIVIGAYDNEEGGDGRGQTYIIFGRSTGWGKYLDIGTNASASFHGVEYREEFGYSVDIIGDTDGDGYDDILVGARMFRKTTGGSMIGHAYLFSGRDGNWSMDVPASHSNATFVGQLSLAGSHVSKAGDVNGDDLADFLITEPENSENKGSMGQTYLILGNRSGWSNGTELSEIDASFWGENSNDVSGYSAEGGGDINGDGYDDLIIGAYRNEEGGKDRSYRAGKIYVVFGRETGLRNDISLSDADASFIGEDPGGALGYCVASAGDVNNDGFDDILAGAWMAGFNDSRTNGIAYLINRTPSQGVTGGQIVPDNSSGSLNLSWDNDPVEPFQYGIYRGLDSSNLERYANTTDPFFEDSEVLVDQMYHYAVVRFCPLGMESEMSAIMMGNVTLDPEENTTEPDDNTTTPDDNETVPDDNSTSPDDNDTEPGGDPGYDDEMPGNGTGPVLVPDDDDEMPGNGTGPVLVPDDDEIPGNNTGPVINPPDDDDKNDPGDDLLLIIPIIGIVLLILILIFIFFLIGRRKKKEEEE